MAADYWTSTQRMKWQFSRDSLQEERKKLVALERKMVENGELSNFPIRYDTYMKIYLHCLITKLGRRLNVRQIALATTEVYLARFLTRVSIKEVNVYLLVTTCIYVSCKIEECPQHIRTIVNEARNLWPEYIPHDATKIAEFEFYLIEEMNSYLILYHPYRPLLQVNEIFNKNNNYGLKLTSEELQNSWSLINDSYVTDLHLIFPPHIIATAALYITLIVGRRGVGQGHNLLVGSHSNGNNAGNNGNNNNNSSNGNNNVNGNGNRTNNEKRIDSFVKFLGVSNIDLDEVIESVQEMISIYSTWETYDENVVKKNLQMLLLHR